MANDQADELVESTGRILLGHARLFGQLCGDLGKRNGGNSGGFGSHG
jgi:hypothetical protein